MYTIEEGMKADSPIYMLTNNATIPVTSNPNNPWFVLLLMLGIMQAMLQVPRYISRGTLGAKPGILQMGFAAYQAKRIIGGLYGTTDFILNSGMLCAILTVTAGQLNLPKVDGAQYAALQNQVGTGDKFGKKAFGGVSSGGAVNPALAVAGAGLLSGISPGQSAGLLRAQAAGMTPAQATTLSSEKSLSSLTAEQMAALTPAQRDALLRAQSAAATPAQAAASASGSNLSSLTPEQIAALNPAQISSLTPTQISSLTPTQISALTQAQNAALTQAQKNALTQAQNNAFTQAQARNTGLVAELLTPTQAQSSALAAGRLFPLTPKQIGALTPQQAAILAAAQQAALAQANTVSLSPDQSSIRAAGKVVSFTQDQINAMTVEQTATLVRAQTAALTRVPSAGAAAAALPTVPNSALPTTSAPLLNPAQTGVAIPLALQTAGLSGLSGRSKISARGGLQLKHIGDATTRVTGKQPHTNLSTWLAQQMRLEGGVTFHVEPDIKKPGITFDDIGIVDTFGLHPSSTKEERALALAATAFANPAGESRMDPGFEDAMLMSNMHRAVRRGGPFNPWNGTNMLGGINQKVMDRLALWLSDGRASRDFKESMYLRTKRIQTKVIVEGINAYMHGKSDGKNGIADYWTDKRGPFDAALQVYRLTDPSAKAGGVNQNALEIRSTLAAANIELTPTTQTAASHPFILSLASTEKPVAIHAMTRLLQASALSQYGEQANRMQKPHLETFYDGLMKHMGEDHVQAATAIARNYGARLCHTAKY